MKRFAILSLTCLVVSGAGPVPAAGAEGAEPLTPDKAVALALENHPALRAASQEVEGAGADKKIARSGYLPRLDLTEDYIHSTNPVFVFASKLGQERFGVTDFALESLNNPDPFTNAATRLVLRQNVWDAGRTILGNQAALLGVDAASGSLERARQQVAFGAIRAFWDAVLADEMLTVARAGEEAAGANAGLASRQVEAGLAVPSDRMSAEVRLSEVRAMRIRAEQGALVARAALRQALGLSEDRVFLLSPPSVGPEPGLSDAAGADAVEGPGGAEARVSEALSSRPDLRSLEVRISQAQVGEKIARSGYLPEVGVGAQYEWNATNPFGNDGDNWSVAASVRVPLFEGLETSARMARARSDRARLEAIREAMAEGIRLEVSAAHADTVAAAERLSVAESALALADEALRIVRERYTEGMAVVVELLGAEAARTQAQGSKVTAARDLALAEAALDLATGRMPAAGGAPTTAAHQGGEEE